MIGVTYISTHCRYSNNGTRTMKKILSCIFQPLRINKLFFLLMMAVLLMPNVTMFFINERSLYLLGCAIMQCCLLAYILCLMVSFIRNRTFRIIAEVLLALPFVVIAICDTGSVLSTKSLINAESMTLIMETSSGEASGFLHQFMTPLKWLSLVLIIIATVVVVFLCMWLWRAADQHAIWRVAIPSLILLLSTGGLVLDIILYPFLGFNDYARLVTWSGTSVIRKDKSRYRHYSTADPVTRYLYIFKKISLFNGDYDKWEVNQEKIWNNTQFSTSADDFDIVLLIGETYIRKHTQIYGYYLPTTPFLQEEKDAGRLIVFEDVLSPSNYTTLSLRNVMSTNRLSDGEPWFEGAYIPMLIRKAGWDIYHYDNQTQPGDRDIGLNKVFYTPLNMQRVYTGVMDRSFDAKDMAYAEYVDNALAPKEKSGKKMVIYHFEGQHFPYSERYPHPGRFSAKDITVRLPWLTEERRRQVADYDNATLHNDSVVRKVMRRWKNRPAIMFYFGDHGDEVWDLGLAGVRNNEQWEDPSWVDRQFHIPFMIWMSDEFQRIYPDKAKRVREGATRRYGTIDLLSYMILGVANPNSPYYMAERDLLNPLYVPKRRVSVTGRVFDK